MGYFVNMYLFLIVQIFFEDLFIYYIVYYKFMLIN